MAPRARHRGVEQIPWLYDVGMGLLEAFGLRPWRAWLTAGARGRILDLGCGTGRNLPGLGGERVVGLDQAWEPLAAARRRAPRAWLVQGRAEALPFRDRAFDTVVSGLVFCSVEEPARGLAEVRRVLAEGGRLRMLEHVRAEERWLAALQDSLQPAWTWLSGGCRPNRDTEAAVTRAGFQIDPASRRAQGQLRRFEASPGLRR